MKGQADTDRDGVVTVDELWGHVKDRTETTARQQGGDQKPQLKGQIGSKFLLTVDSDRLIRNTQESRAYMARLKDLFLAAGIDKSSFEEASSLLATDDARLDSTQQKRKQVYGDLATGTLAPQYLQAALGAIETPQQRAERQKRERISELLARARANDSKPNGRRALSALDDLLRLDPYHKEATSLKDRINAYYAKPGDIKTNSIDMKLVYIPKGEFMMGSRLSREEIRETFGGKSEYYKDEHPRHRVRISQGFWLGAYEVTRGQFAEFARASRHETSAEKAGKGYGMTRDEGWSLVNSLDWRSPGIDQQDNHPVVQVSWYDAVAFCQWLTKKEGKQYRLPTEAQWEYSCRARTTGVFNWGSSLDDAQQYTNTADEAAERWIDQYGRSYPDRLKADDGYANTAPVGSFRPNAFGLYDMHGNVSEWCQDGPRSYAENSTEDPGSQSDMYRVLRGGSWYDFPWYCRAAFRGGATPDSSHISAGFRVLCVSED